jgi:flagellar biosynthesis protein FliQ
LQRYNYLPVLTNIQKIIGGKISIWVSLFQITNPNQMCLTTVPRISLYVVMRFFVYFLCFLLSYYPEQLRHIIAHVCLMSHRQTGNIRSFILEHIVINNQNCTGILSLVLKFPLIYFFTLNMHSAAGKLK